MEAADSPRWYYYTQSGEQVGPMDFTALQSAAEAGRLQREDYVWREGDADWRPAAGVSELFPPPGGAVGQGAGEATFQQPQQAPAWFFGYAGFWRRVVAYLIDAIVLSAVLGVATWAIGPNDPQQFTRVDLASIVLGWLYFAGMESSSTQATLGKMALNIKVTDMVGQPIGFGRATGRHFGKILSGLILGIGFLMVAFTPRRQGLHDMLADCLVVKGG